MIRRIDPWKYKFIPDPDYYSKPFDDAQREIVRAKSDSSLLIEDSLRSFDYWNWVYSSLIQYVDRLDASLSMYSLASLPSETETTNDGTEVTYHLLMSGPFVGHMAVRESDTVIYGAYFKWDKSITP